MSTHNMFLWRKIKKKSKTNYSHFFNKNTCELPVDIVLTRAVNILTANELVKLMTL